MLCMTTLATHGRLLRDESATHSRGLPAGVPRTAVAYLLPAGLPSTAVAYLCLSPQIGIDLLCFAEQVGDVVGVYTLRQQIGEGGFGLVWMAEQSKLVYC